MGSAMKRRPRDYWRQRLALALLDWSRLTAEVARLEAVAFPGPPVTLKQFTELVAEGAFRGVQAQWNRKSILAGLFG